MERNSDIVHHYSTQHPHKITGIPSAWELIGQITWSFCDKCTCVNNKIICNLGRRTKNHEVCRPTLSYFIARSKKTKKKLIYSHLYWHTLTHTYTNTYTYTFIHIKHNAPTLYFFGGHLMRQSLVFGPKPNHTLQYTKHRIRPTYIV